MILLHALELLSVLKEKMAFISTAYRLTSFCFYSFRAVAGFGVEALGTCAQLHLNAQIN